MNLTGNDKIIFLDVDGVLNSAEFYHTDYNGKRNLARIDSKAVARLKKIVDKTGAKVVVSSAWRFYCLDDLLRELSPVEIYPVDTTKIESNFYFTRASEIKEWLDRHPQIDKFVVLDDLYMEISDIRAHHIHTTEEKGLEDWHIARAVEILNGDLNDVQW